MAIRRSITELKAKHFGQDIWVVVAGASMEYVDPEFFKNKITIGVNQVYRQFPCTYLVRKDAPLSEEAALTGIPLIIAEHDGGGYANPKNEVSVDAWFFGHPDLDEGRVLPVDDTTALEVIGSDGLIVSHSTITTGLHAAAYLGAANIILCGHDGGTLDGKINYPGYHALEPTAAEDAYYRGWVRMIMYQTTMVRARLQKVYGCRIYTLNPFIGFLLDGHNFQP